MTHGKRVIEGSEDRLYENRKDKDEGETKNWEKRDETMQQQTLSANSHYTNKHVVTYTHVPSLLELRGVGGGTLCVAGTKDSGAETHH